MPIRISRYFRVDPSELKSRGVFDAHLGIDNKLFVDPNLVKRCAGRTLHTLESR